MPDRADREVVVTRRIASLAAGLLLPGFLLGTPALADEHSLDAVRTALQSPIPESAIAQARELDDQLLRSGTVNGSKFYLVTDQRLQRVQGIVRRLLAAIGQDPQTWVVRVLENQEINAFVLGGKYIYVYTALLDQVQSDDELAVVLGHEIGHSVLKHNIRRDNDLTSQLADLASTIGQIKGGSGGVRAVSMGAAFRNAYTRDNEREADAFGVLAAWRAKFDPLRGADFFSRMLRSGNGVTAAQAYLSDHPADQERLASIAAETDWLHRARSLDSLKVYPRAFTVIVALVQTNSPIFAGVPRTGGAKQDTQQQPQQPAQPQVVQAQSPQRVQSLSDQYDACVHLLGASECTDLKQRLDAQSVQVPTAQSTQARVAPAPPKCVVQNGRFVGPGC